MTLGARVTNHVDLIEGNSANARHLPSPNCKVTIIDITDLRGFRNAEAAARDPQSAKLAYLRGAESYQVKVEDFRGFLERNPEELACDGHEPFPDPDLFFELWDVFDEGNDDEFVYADEESCLRLCALRLAAKKESLTEDDWVEYCEREFTVPAIDETKYRCGLSRGQRSEKIAGLVRAVQDDRITLPTPCFIRPGVKFGRYLLALQKKYLSEIAEGLASFDYPAEFQRAVWQEAIDGLPDEGMRARVQAERIDCLHPYELPAPSAVAAGGLPRVVAATGSGFRSMAMKVALLAVALLAAVWALREFQF